MSLRATLAAARFFRGNPHLMGYTIGKSLLDPAYRTVARGLLGSPLPLLDLGCGAGHLAAFLRAAGYGAPVTGVDLDTRKIAAARRFLEGAGCVFFAGRAEEPPAHCGHVAALDVIHYLPPDRQADFVAAVAARLAPGGKAFLRLTLRDHSLRFRLSALEEGLIRRAGWIPWKGEAFPERGAVEGWAGATGCRWALAPLWGCTPFNSFLLRLEREERRPDGLACAMEQ